MTPVSARLLASSIGLILLTAGSGVAKAVSLRGTFDDTATYKPPVHSQTKTESEPVEEKEDEDDEGPASPFKYIPYAAASVGYDSNFDEDVDEIDSYFQSYDLGLSMTYEKDGTFIELKAEGEIWDLMELSDSDRWFYNVSLDGETEISEQTRFLFGFDRQHDALTDPEAITNEVFSGIKWKGDNRAFRFRGSLEHEINLTQDDDFGNAAADEFDFIKLTADVKYQIWTQKKISPFVRAKISTLDFPGQDTSFINRNGEDYALIGGATLKPTDKLTVDLAGRYNLRNLDDVIIPRHSNGFVDLDLTWKPNKKFAFYATIERELNEPGAESSVVEDSTSYEVEAEWTPTKKVQMVLGATYQKEEEIGEDEIEREWSVSAAGYYSIAEHVRLFTKIRNIWNEEEVVGTPVEKYKRLEVRIGVETNF